MRASKAWLAEIDSWRFETAAKEQRAIPRAEAIRRLVALGLEQFAQDRTDGEADEARRSDEALRRELSMPPQPQKSPPKTKDN